MPFKIVDNIWWRKAIFTYFFNFVVAKYDGKSALRCPKKPHILFLNFLMGYLDQLMSGLSLFDSVAYAVEVLMVQPPIGGLE